MIEFLRDPIWQFVGSVLGLIAIIVTTYSYFIQRRRKSLAYEMLTDTKLLTVGEEIMGDVKILFKSDYVKDVHLVLLRIQNKGDLAIKPDDYEEPIILSFGKNAKILSAEVTSVSPQNLNPNLTILESKIEIEKILLNKSDNFTIKLLLTGYERQIETETRIIGIQKMRRVINWKGLISAFVGPIGGVLVFAAIVLFTLQFSGEGQIFELKQWQFYVLFTLTFLFSVFYYAVYYVRR